MSKPARDHSIIENIGYLVWKERYFRFKDIEAKLEPYSAIQSNGPTLKDARRALMLTVRAAARAMGVCPSSYLRLESNAEAGAISLRAMERAAKAIGCRVVYAIVPQEFPSFSAKLWQEILPYIRNDQMKGRQEWWYKTNFIATVASERVNDANFRRMRGWSERVNASDFVKYKKTE